ncbi:MAG: hypothetical protein V4628_16790 [Pseudomonadota bacterium]
MFLVIVNKALKSRGRRFPAKKPGLGIRTSLVAYLAMPISAFAICPDLKPYYQTPDQIQWPGDAVLNQLTLMMPECLESAEYFALLGAAQLNSGLTPEALESLERALLLDPDNGAARIDYAQALYIAGQLFPALEINQSLLDRPDLPSNLQGILQARGKEWKRQTRSKGLFAELAAGYDNNLNGAPSKSDFTLTLSGEPISFELSPDFQPLSGPYVNLQLAGYYRKLDSQHSQNVQFGLRSRQSEESSNELLQFDWRYTFLLPVRKQQWELSAGTSHLLFGGNPLYSVTEGRIRYRFRDLGCNPHYELAAQHQLYHGQSSMTGIESSVIGGVDCARGNQRFGIQAGPLNNSALKTRLGGDRQGWKVRMNWQLQVGADLVTAQLGYASLYDKSGYSSLLENNARRDVHTTSAQIQYSHQLQSDLSLIINLNHQGQDSNIGPFESDSTAFEVGIRLNL